MSFSTDLFLEYKKRPGKPALARLLERHQDAVYALCHQVLRHPQDAEDACQEVLLEVSRQVDAIDEPDRFAGWLYRTALHTALDFKRKRGRQQVRERAAQRPGETTAEAADASDALHRGLAGLDDTSRQLVVEHYFARRPLRELAAERGCSEVAVWKRIQNARERLKKSLGSAVVSALEGIGTVRAPAGLLKQALLRGGLTMAASTGIKFAIVAPLVLLAGGGIAMMVRRPPSAPIDPPPKQTVAAAPAVPFPAAGPVEPSPAGATVPRRSEPAKAAATRRPYPYPAPRVAAGKEAAAHTWEILNSKRVDFDFSDAAVAEILEYVRRVTGLTIIVDPGAIDGEQVSFKVRDLLLDGALRLLLLPREKDYEIRSDGTLRIGKKQDIAGGYEREARELPDLQRLMGLARSMMDQGWDGLSPEEPPKPAVPSGNRITVPQGETSLAVEIQRLEEEHRIQVQVDYPTTSAETFAAWRELMEKRFLQVVEEKSAAEHVEQLARRSGLVVVPQGGDSYRLTTVAQARKIREAEEERKRQAEENHLTLAKPLPETGPVGVQDLVDAMSRVSGWEVVPSPEVWDSGASVTLPSGTTLRGALDALKAQGFRWGRFYGKLFILR